MPIENGKGVSNLKTGGPYSREKVQGDLRFLLSRQKGSVLTSSLFFGGD